VIAGGLAAILLLLGAGVVFLFAWLHAGASAQFRSSGPNALWAGHDWVGGAHSAADYELLDGILRRGAFTDVFFHVGPLEADGVISPTRYRYAGSLLRHLNDADPLVRPQAWIGQIEAGAGGPLDLSNAQVQASVVQTAATLLRLGFAGIHYDIEPIDSGDPSFLHLLRMTHDLTLRSGAVLSVAADNLDPAHALHGLFRRALGRDRTWSGEYFAAVAGEVDQIAVMSYGSGWPTAWLYEAFLKWEVPRLLAEVGQRITLFIGVETYAQPGWSFLRNGPASDSGIEGIQRAISGIPRSGLANFGVAIYADWTTDATEWRAYQTSWVDGPRERRLLTAAAPDATARYNTATQMQLMRTRT
jgi:hypothetical protein